MLFNSLSCRSSSSAYECDEEVEECSYPFSLGTVSKISCYYVKIYRSAAIFPSSTSRSCSGRNSSGSSEQLFASPYQDVRSNPYGWSEPRPSFNRGCQQQHHQANRWQNRRSCGTPQGHSRGSYNKRPFDARQQEVDIRAYVIPAMTGNPWKHLEEQWNAEHNSVISTKSATSN